jgi:hypothetical protein
MRNSFYLACGAVLALGACSGGGGANVAMETGEWETTVELTNLNTGNLPEDIRRGMTGPQGRRQTERGCWPMTADRVRIENLRFASPEPALRDVSCTVAELVMEGGTLRGRMSCAGIPVPPQMGATSMTVSGELDGSYTPNTLQATASGEVRFGDRSGSATVRISSRRLGACPARPRYTPPPPYSGLQSPTDMNAVMAVPPPPDPGESAREAMNRATEDALRGR